MEQEKRAQLMKCRRIMRSMARELNPNGYKGMWFQREIIERRAALWGAIEELRRLIQGEYIEKDGKGGKSV